jgi:hypothetical protein
MQDRLYVVVVINVSILGAHQRVEAFCYGNFMTCQSHHHFALSFPARHCNPVMFRCIVSPGTDVNLSCINSEIVSSTCLIMTKRKYVMPSQMSSLT